MENIILGRSQAQEGCYLCYRFRKGSVLLFHNLTLTDAPLDLRFTVLHPNLQAVDAFGGEVLCTFLLVMTVFAATDGQLGRKNAFIGPLLPWVISMAVFLGEVMLFIAPAIVHGDLNLAHGNRTPPPSPFVGCAHPMPLREEESIFRNQSIPR